MRARSVVLLFFVVACGSEPPRPAFVESMLRCPDGREWDGNRCVPARPKPPPPASAASAAPSTPPPPAPTALRAVDALEGTTWSGADSDGDEYVFWFDRRGHLRYRSPTGTYDDPTDTWSQDGAKIHIEMTGGYAVYDGVIENGTMHGRARNQTGKKWTWSMTLSMTPESQKSH